MSSSNNFQNPVVKTVRRKPGGRGTSDTASNTHTLSNGRKKLTDKGKQVKSPVSKANVKSETFQFDQYTARPLVNSAAGSAANKHPHKMPVEMPRFMLKKKPTTLLKTFKQNKWDLANQQSLRKLEASHSDVGVTTQGLYDKFRLQREKERVKLEQLGLVDKADTSKRLTDALDFQGSCLEMCPVFERIRRELENNVSALEKQNDFISPEKAIKAFARPAASAPPPLPADVRPPNVLVKTLNYIVENVLQTLPENEPFIWDRTRSIRQDFTLQNYYGPECVDCCEKIVRIHLLTLHIMIKNNATFSKQQELEQLNKSVVTLCEIYDEGKKKGIKYPNEAEIRSYWCLLNPRDPELDNQIQLLPKHVLKDKNFQLSLTFRRVMSNSFFKERGHKSINNGLNLTSTFFKLLEVSDTPLLLSCFLETYINEIRFYGVLKLKQTWSKKVTKSLSFDILLQLLKFNNDEEIIELSDFYSITVDKQSRTIDLSSLIHDTHLIPEKIPLRDTYLKCIENKLTKFASYSEVINSGQKNSLKMFQNIRTPSSNYQSNKGNVKSSLEKASKNPDKNTADTFKTSELKFGQNEKPSPYVLHEGSSFTKNQTNENVSNSINLRTVNNETAGERGQEEEKVKESSFKNNEKNIKFSQNLNTSKNNLKFSFGSDSTDSSIFNEGKHTQTQHSSLGTNNSNLSVKNDENPSTKSLFNFPSTNQPSQQALGFTEIPKFQTSADISINKNEPFQNPNTQTPDRPSLPILNPEISKKQHSESPMIDAALIKKNTFKIVYKEILAETSDLILDDVLVKNLVKNTVMETKSSLHYAHQLKKLIIGKLLRKYRIKQLAVSKLTQIEDSIKTTKKLISNNKQRKVSLLDFLQNQSNASSKNLLNFTPVKNEKKQLKVTKDLLENHKDSDILKHYLSHINYNINTNNNFNKFMKINLNWVVYTSNWQDSSIRSILKMLGMNQIPFIINQEKVHMKISRYKPEFIPNDTQLLIFNTGITRNDIFDVDDFMASEFNQLKRILHDVGKNNNYKIDILILYWSNKNGNLFDFSSLSKFDIVNSLEMINIRNNSFMKDLKVSMNGISTKFKFKLNGIPGEEFLQSKLKQVLETRIVGRSPMLEKKTLDSINERLWQINKELLETDENIKDNNNEDEYYLFDESNRKRKLTIVNSERKKQKITKGTKHYNLMNASNNSSNSTFESPPPNMITSKKGIPTLVIDNANNQRKSTFNHKNKRLITPVNNIRAAMDEEEEEHNDAGVLKSVSTPSTSSIESILQFIKTPISKIKN